ncbi:MAG: cytochrome c oxidase subunit II [Flavobacteriaceae bacterium]|jgi:cytochrome c oxidase subunit II|nr:cytochrome c oxidase subunit II [Flavobacteriaceae bacterium]MBT7895952.1 cytochrome c oxidase subunit II [Flavobacteriales bacterium]|tara:strand:+ start:30 stop:1004 length:975 start_codon:yes stop_codon:yes gene_type:complete
MTNILIALVVILTIAALVQLVRVNELLSEITDKDTNAVTDDDNKKNGILFLLTIPLFMGFVVWQMVTWDHLLLPPASSIHGAEIDSLMKVSMTLILVVFFILTPMLFFFAYKYRGKKGNTAYFFSHNNKLEIIWTVVPTIILTVLIVYGLKTWDRAMNTNFSDATVIEIYSKQFDWTARYSGLDKVLGKSNYRLVKGKNVLGVDMLDKNSSDDMVVKEVHLPVNKPVLLMFRSRDVIHSAFLPHFRVQMNCVPGLSTQFAFTPTKTTAQMKESEGDDFEYVLLCNKICGSAHFNMQMKFIIESEEDYNKWISSQKTLQNTLTLK